MKRYFPFLLTILLFSLAACLSTPTPRPSVQRTPVPTWSLPFPVTTLTAPAKITALPNTTPGPGTPTQPAANGPTLTASPTARPGIDPTLGVTTPDPSLTPEIPIPEPMPQLYLDKNIINILLIGRDTAKDAKSYRTDVMIVASINKTANSVTLLSIPRDLYVYIPGWTMNRINTAAVHGDTTGYPGGGIALLEQTILYNLGIPIHGWARIDFGGFKQVVDILGGVDIPVECAMQDWRLKSPELDQEAADNWEMYTVEPGVIHMDGDYALWYARARKHSSDYDRSRRQHQVLRAMFDKALQLNVIPKIPDLYAQYIQIVDTDLGLGDILQFVPMATTLDRARIKSRFIGRDQIFGYTTSQGAQVLLPDRDAITRLLAEAFQPPAENTLARPATAVEIWNGTNNKDWAVLAADNLAWAGIIPVPGAADATTYATTTLYDFTTTAKGSARPALQDIFHVADANVVAQPDPNAKYPYRIILGSDYNSCVKPTYIVRPTMTPMAAVAPPPPGNIVHAAPIIGSPPPIDGDLSEWSVLPYPVSEPIFGRENWRGAGDLSGQWNMAWDDRYLYLAIRIKDDVFAQSATGENIFRGDSLELWIDIDPGSRTNALTERDFQAGISPGNLAAGATNGEAYLWQPREQAHQITDATIASRLIDGGYQMEIALPWSNFRLVPFAGEGFAFTLVLNDNDTPGSTEQQTQAASVENAKLSDPRTWGILVLDTPAGP